MKLLFIVLLFLSKAYGQVASFKEVKVAYSYSTVVFPVIFAKNKTVSARINHFIRKEIISGYNNSKSLSANINDFIGDITSANLSYQVTYNRKILSITIDMEMCAAYCSSASRYFNFDLQTGNALTINDIIIKDKLDSFKQTVTIDKTQFLNDYKLKEKDLINNGIDSADYNWIIETVDNYCINLSNIEHFRLSPGFIEIIDACEFAHAIQSQQPDYTLKYSYNQISRFIKPGIKLH